MKNQNINKQSLDRFISGKYSRTDYKKVRSWFSNDDPLLKESMNDHWKDIPGNQSMDDRLLTLMSHVTQVIGNKPQKPVYRVLKYYQRIAAILLVPLIIGVLLWYLQLPEDSKQAFATIQSPQGARTEFTLPDGTTGWLNNGSKLTYPVQFENTREVALKGEAFFKVIHNHGQKFRVRTNEISVQVLGTSFNVAAYENEPQVSVILQEGSVKILDSEQHETCRLNPNEEFNYDRQKKKAVVRKVDAENQVLWIKGILRFDGDPLSEVMKKLGRWYNVDFEFKDQTIQTYNFKATFKDETLEEILRMISLTTPMNYTIQERQTNEKGIYEKKKVIIEAN